MSQVRDMLEQLKRRVRSRGLTYGDLAQRMNVSESTVKRWFSTGSFDVERLDEFVAILDMNLGDLFASKRSKFMQTMFTEDQELELAHNEGLLSTLYLLLSGSTYSRILDEFELSPAKLQSYLLRLDHLNLIELHPENIVVPLIQSNTRWLPRGPLNEKYGELIRQSFMNSEFTDIREKFWLLSGKASDATLQVFSRKFDALLAELQDYFDLDQDLSDKEAPLVTLFAAHRPWRFPVVQLQRRKKSI